MAGERYGASRRALLVGAALLPLAGCGSDERPRAASSSAAARPAVGPKFAALERRYGVRLGVYAVATNSGAALAYRADERFAFCSTFKTLAAAAVLHNNPLSHLEKRVTYTRADVNSISPITKDHIGTGMTIQRLCEAAVIYSDGTAGNLLMRDAGGPAGLTAYMRRLQDSVSRMDNYEPELNRDRPKDPRDTTTPHAIATDHRRLVLEDALPPEKRALLRGWMERGVTGAARIRAGLPKGWRLAHKTGTGDYGRANDVAVVWPPGKAPFVLAVMTDRDGYSTPPKEAAIAEATRLVVSEFS
ncbi:class A beta-lactamase [Actinomadura terrae]|uniref:class A beta-lactamase n=1 Tax=Actinomadura terrae TaxID=604353 RepID=UPI002342BE89